MLRTTEPHTTGDSKVSDAVVSRALAGQPLTCWAVLGREELAREAAGLAERAFIQMENTPHARKTPRTEESRGLAMEGAVPVLKGGQVVGVINSGVLMNRNFAFVDRIRDVAYGNEEYKGAPVGTATCETKAAASWPPTGGSRGRRSSGARRLCRGRSRASQGA